MPNCHNEEGLRALQIITEYYDAYVLDGEIRCQSVFYLEWPTVVIIKPPEAN